MRLPCNGAKMLAVVPQNNRAMEQNVKFLLTATVAQYIVFLAMDLHIQQFHLPGIGLLPNRSDDRGSTILSI